MAQHYAAPADTNQEPAPADSRSSKITTLKQQLEELEARTKKIEAQEIEIVKAMEKLQVDFPSRKLQIIAFVKAIEKANQYFELKDHLRDSVDYVMHDSDKLVAFERLVKEDKVHHRFDKLDFQDILDAVKERISDLHYKRDDDLKLEQEKNGGGVRNPFLNLVYSALEKSYVLHEDPKAELDLMKKHNRDYYYQCFIGGLITKCSEKTVFVRNISSSHDEMRVKASFSACGEVESVILEYFNRCSQVAYVTFKNSVGAKLAPILKSDWCYNVEPVLEYAERPSNVRTELAEALKTYKTLRTSFGERVARPLLK